MADRAEAKLVAAALELADANRAASVLVELRKDVVHDVAAVHVGGIPQREEEELGHRESARRVEVGLVEPGADGRRVEGLAQLGRQARVELVEVERHVAVGVGLGESKQLVLRLVEHLLALAALTRQPLDAAHRLVHAVQLESVGRVEHLRGHL